MTDLLHDVDAPSDAELISRVRGGDVAAYGDLFARHVDAAKRLSRQLVRGPDADDLVSDAFAKVLSVLQGGGGPDVAFRAYLLTAVRRLHVDKIRSGARLQTSDDMEAFDAGVPFQDTAVAAFESGAAAKAFASLPERWQLVLWHLEVEGQKPADIAPLLGMSPNSVSALAYRAREGLRQAFLTMHLNDISETDCRWVNAHLGAYVRNGLAKRDSVKVRSHLDECRRCTAMYLELTEVNSNLAAIIAPLLLGAAATGYLASAGGAAGGFGLSAMFGRVRDVVSANAGVATAGAVAAAVAAAAAAGILLLPSSSGPDTVVGADRPVQTVSTPPAAGGSDGPAGGKKDRKPTSDESVAGPTGQLPSELPSTSDSPGAVTVLDPGTTTGDGATTGDGTTSGDTANPPGDQTSNPSQPGPPQPGPTQPGPDQPGPSEPAPTQPGPTQPAPTQPGPTQPAPTQPAPTTTAPPPPPTTTAPPPPAGVLSSDVGFTVRPSYADGTVSFAVQGTPELPPELDVTLATDEPNTGIVFTTGGNCEPDPLHPEKAACLTGSSTATTTFARTASTTTASGGFIASIPLRIPDTAPSTRVTITVSVPAGYDDPDANNNVDSFYYTAPDTKADIVFTSLTPQEQTPNAEGDYVLTGHLTGIPSTVDTMAYTVDEGATFSASSDSCTVVSSSEVICATGPDPQFVVRPAVKTLDKTKVTITALVPDGYTDDTSDNSATATLLPRETTDPWSDIALEIQGPSTIQLEDGSYRFSGTISGIPAGTVFVGVDLVGDAAVTSTGNSACTPTEAGFNCVPAGAGSVGFTLTLQSPDTSVDQVISLSITHPSGYDGDTVSNNSSGEITLEAASSEPSTLAFAAGPDAVLRAGKIYTVSAALSGIPSGAESIEFSLVRRSGDGTEGRFTEVQLTEPLVDCAASGNTLTCPTKGSSDFAITFVAEIPSGKFDLTATAGGQTTSGQITEAGAVEPSVASTTESSSLLRTAPDTSSTTVATRNLVSATRTRLSDRPAVKADAPAEKHAKHDAKGAQGKHTAKGHDRTTPAAPAAPAKDAKDAKKADKPTKSDPGSDKPAKADPPGPGGQTDDPAGGNDGKTNGNDDDPGKKSEPGPVQRIIDIVGGLIP